MAHGLARWSFVTVTLLLCGPGAFAQTDQPLPGQLPMSQRTTTQPVQWVGAARFRMDCGQDVQRFCHGVQPGEGRLIQCLSSHRSQLSPACISRLAAARTPVRPPLSRDTQSAGLPSASPPPLHAVTEWALRASCGPDVQRLCAGVSRQNGGVIKCLGSQRMELSPTCDVFVSENPTRRDAQKGAPKTPPPPTNRATATPAAAHGAAETFASPLTNGPAAKPTAADGATDTVASPPNGPAAMPAEADSAADTVASPPTAGPAATPAAADGAADTVASSPTAGPVATPAAADDAAADGAADTVASSPTIGLAATATPNGAAATVGPPATGDPAARSAVANGRADTVAPPPTNDPPTTSAPPAGKSPPATGALNIRL
jgi:Cysteine rich repeat